MSQIITFIHILYWELFSSNVRRNITFAKKKANIFRNDMIVNIEKLNNQQMNY